MKGQCHIVIAARRKNVENDVNDQNCVYFNRLKIEIGLTNIFVLLVGTDYGQFWLDLIRKGILKWTACFRYLLFGSREIIIKVIQY